MTSIVALIPARGGSVRVPGKNLRLLNGVSLIAWKIQQAQKAGIFVGVWVSTDSDAIVSAAMAAGVTGVICRPPEFATATSPDIEWVRHALAQFDEPDEAFAILRCTSPFFGPVAMREAWLVFQHEQPCDSLRVVKPGDDPGKLWTVDELGHLRPVLPYLHPSGTPWHSSQSGVNPPVWKNAGAMEIAWTRVVRAGSISGDVIVPFKLESNSVAALDINTEEDFALAQKTAEWWDKE